MVKKMIKNRHVLIDFGLVSASSDSENKILVPNHRYEQAKEQPSTNLCKRNKRKIIKISITNR